MRAGGQRELRVERSADLAERQVVIEPVAINLAQRHHFDQGQLQPLPVRPAQQFGDFKLVHALERHGVELNRQPSSARRRNALEHLRQAIAPGQRGELGPIKRIERDIDSPHARSGEIVHNCGQLGSVGGQGQLVQPVPQRAAQRADQFEHIAPDQGLAPGQPDFGHPTRDEAQGQLVQFFQAQHLAARQKGLPFGHAI